MSGRTRQYFDDTYQKFVAPAKSTNIDMRQFDSLPQGHIPKCIDQKRNVQQEIDLDTLGCGIEESSYFLLKMFVALFKNPDYKGIMIAQFLSIIGVVALISIWLDRYQDSELIELTIGILCTIIGMSIVIGTVICLHNFVKRLIIVSILDNKNLMIGVLCGLGIIFYKLIIGLSQIVLFYTILIHPEFMINGAINTILYTTMLIVVGIDAILNTTRHIIGSVYEVYIIFHKIYIPLHLRLNEASVLTFANDSENYRVCDDLHNANVANDDFCVSLPHKFSVREKTLRYRINISKKSDYDQRFETHRGVRHCVDCESQTGRKHIQIVHPTRFIDFRSLIFALCCFFLSHTINSAYYDYDACCSDSEIETVIMRQVEKMCVIILSALLLHILIDICATVYVFTRKHWVSEWSMGIVRFSFSFSVDAILGCFVLFVRGYLMLNLYGTNTHYVLWLIGVVLGYFAQVVAYGA